MSQAVAVLSGAQVVYKDEENLVKEVQQEIKKAAEKNQKLGRAMGAARGRGMNSLPDKMSEKFISLGRTTVAGGTLYFYGQVVKLGALAVDEVPPSDRWQSGMLTEDQLDAQSQA